MNNTRALAANVLRDVVFKQQTLNQVLPQASEALAANDKAFLAELCYGCLRWYSQLQAVANVLLHRPLKNKNQDILCLLLVGIYQVLHLSTPSYAAVSETVNATQAFKKSWARGLLNKTLRHLAKDPEAILEQLPASAENQYLHPQWLLEAIQTAWPEQWQAVLTANNAKAPLYLRVNLNHSSVEQQLAKLPDALAAKSVENFPEAIQLDSTNVESLPGFAEGDIYVQDLAGQLAVDLLELKPGQQILDACAAPGSKTTHILSRQPNCHVTAIDNNPKRLGLLPQNMRRLKLPHDQLHLVLADAGHTKEWWQGQPFDRILLDAPCTGTGVIRRHPEIKWLRTLSQMQILQKQQQYLLEKLWPLLAPGGLLLYSTCSILPQENSQQIKRFLSKHNEAKLQPISLPLGSATEAGWQILPEEQWADGFFYALIKKAKK
jgi:16S rRNA (cytosine967-C5)-methyltransferase